MQLVYTRLTLGRMKRKVYLDALVSYLGFILLLSRGLTIVVVDLDETVFLCFFGHRIGIQLQVRRLILEIEAGDDAAVQCRY